MSLYQKHDDSVKPSCACAHKEKMKTFADVKRKAKPTELKAGGCFRQTYRYKRQANIWNAVRDFVTFFSFIKLWYKNNIFFAFIKLSYSKIILSSYI